jgi:hypothetical protein
VVKYVTVWPQKDDGDGSSHRDGDGDVSSSTMVTTRPGSQGARGGATRLSVLGSLEGQVHLN